VIVTFNPLKMLYSLTDQELTLSNRDRTRQYKVFLSFYNLCLYKNMGTKSAYTGCARDRDPGSQPA
jgi:hypothetical protein